MSIEFTGSGQRFTVDTGAAIDHKSFTIAGKFKITSNTTCSLAEIITTSTRVLRLWYDATSGEIKVSEVYQGVTAVVGSVTVNTWFTAGLQGQDRGTDQLRLHGFVVPSGGTFSAAYVDSNQYFDQLNSIFVGTSEDDTSDWLRGYAADFHLWSSFLTQSQIEAQATRQAAITSTALIGSNYFDGGTIAAAKTSNVSNQSYFDTWAAADSDGTSRTDPVYNADAPAYVGTFIVSPVSPPIQLPDENPVVVTDIAVVQSALGVTRGYSPAEWAEFATNPGYRNIVVAVMGGWTDAPSSVTIEDSLGLTWTQRIADQYTDGGSGPHMIMWTAPVLSGAGVMRARPVMTGATAAPWVTLALIEVSRANVASLIDGTPVSNTGSGTSASADHATTTNAYDLMVSGLTYGNSYSSLASWGGSYSEVVTKQAESNVSVAVRGVASTGNYDPSATLNVSSTWVMAALALKQQSAGVAPTITTTSIANQTAGAAGAVQIEATGSGPITFSLSGEPAGVQITAGGYLSWPATLASQLYSFTVIATNASGTDTQALALQIGAAVVAPTIVTTALPTFQVGVPKGFPLVASGTGPFFWSTTSTLPNGITVSGSTLGGTATAEFSANITLVVEGPGGSSQAASQTYALVVVAADDPPPSSGSQWVRLPRGTETWVRIPRAT